MLWSDADSAVSSVRLQQGVRAPMWDFDSMSGMCAVLNRPHLKGSDDGFSSVCWRRGRLRRPDNSHLSFVAAVVLLIGIRRKTAEECSQAVLP